jgi:hypothetical protein
MMYLHVHKYKLFARPESAHEHRIHTLQAIFFSGVVFTLVSINFQGAMLFVAIAFVAADIGAELADILCEKKSRASIGGLSTFEYLLHVMMSTTKYGFVALAFAAKPSSAWHLGAPVVSDQEYPLIVRAIGWTIVGVGILSMAVQLWLQQPKYRVTNDPGSTH